MRDSCFANFRHVRTVSKRWKSKMNILHTCTSGLDSMCCLDLSWLAEGLSLTVSSAPHLGQGHLHGFALSYFTGRSYTMTSQTGPRYVQLNMQHAGQKAGCVETLNGLHNLTVAPGLICCRYAINELQPASEQRKVFGEDRWIFWPNSNPWLE